MTESSTNATLLRKRLPAAYKLEVWYHTMWRLKKGEEYLMNQNFRRTQLRLLYSLIKPSK